MPDVSHSPRFEHLLAETYDPLMRYARRRVAPDDADDVVADVLLTIWRRIDDVPDEPLPWVYGVARNVIANHRRSRRRHLSLVARLESQPGPRWSSPPDPDGLDPELERALMVLQESERDILRLWAWEQLEPREIAEVLGTSPNAASLRLRRARAKLTSELERQKSGTAGHELMDKAEESA